MAEPFNLVKPCLVYSFGYVTDCTFEQSSKIIRSCLPCMGVLGLTWWRRHYGELSGGWGIRSSNTYLLSIPTGVTSDFSSRSFSVSAPSTWNSLPQHIRSIDRRSTFKCQLKSHFLQSAFNVWSPCASASDSFPRFWLYINLFLCYVCMGVRRVSLPSMG